VVKFLWIKEYWSLDLNKCLFFEYINIWVIKCGGHYLATYTNINKISEINRKNIEIYI